MTKFKALPLAFALGVSAVLAPMTAPLATAQVTSIDVAWAQSSIMNAGTRAAQVAKIKKVPSVGVIRLDVPTFEMFGGDIPTWQEFRIMVQKNAGGVAKLQRALSANPVTRAALAKNHVQPWQVAGVQVGSTGSLRLYIFSQRHW